MPEFLRGSALGAGQIPSLRFDPLQPSAVPGGLAALIPWAPGMGRPKFLLNNPDLSWLQG